MVVVLAGEMDLATAPDHERLLADAAVDANGGIVVDLAEVTFMDVSGLNVLLRAGAGRPGAGPPMLIVRARPQVERVFALVGLAHLLHVGEEAVTARVGEHEHRLGGLADRATVEQAKGVLMAQHHCNLEAASALLVTAAKLRNIGISDIADEIVTAAARAHPRLASAPRA